MSPGPVDRREFLAGTGGLFLCTLAGHKVFLNKGADTEKLASGLKVPPRVAAADAEAQRGRAEGRTVLAAETTRHQRPRVLDSRRAGQLEHRPLGARRDDGPAGQGQDPVQGLRLPPVHAELRQPDGAGDDPRPADRGGGGRPDRRPLPEQALDPGHRPPARRLLLGGHGRHLQGQVHRPGGIRAAEPDLPLRLGGPPRYRRRLALPRPRPDGPAARVQGAVRDDDHPQAG